jgi:hypothetical protein
MHMPWQWCPSGITPALAHTFVRHNIRSLVVEQLLQNRGRSSIQSTVLMAFPDCMRCIHFRDALAHGDLRILFILQVVNGLHKMRRNSTCRPSTRALPQPAPELAIHIPCSGRMPVFCVPQAGPPPPCRKFVTGYKASQSLLLLRLLPCSLFLGYTVQSTLLFIYNECICFLSF